MPVCTKCKTNKTKRDFYKDRTKKSGLRPTCKQCYNPTLKEGQKAYCKANKEARNERAKKWYKQNKEKALNRKKACPKERVRLRKKQLRQYGLSIEDYNEMYEAQGGVCDICHDKPRGTLCVDHCHDTEEVRGLLCSKCNTGIGFFEDNPELVKEALKYLRKHS